MKKLLAAAMVIGIWSAPTAAADSQDDVLMSFLRANHVAVDRGAAINAAHIACSQVHDRLSFAAVAVVVAQQVPAVKGSEDWIIAGARKAYCPPAPG